MKCPKCKNKMVYRAYLDSDKCPNCLYTLSGVMRIINSIKGGENKMKKINKPIIDELHDILEATDYSDIDFDMKDLINFLAVEKPLQSFMEFILQKITDDMGMIDEETEDKEEKEKYEKSLDRLIKAHEVVLRGGSTIEVDEVKEKVDDDNISEF